MNSPTSLAQHEPSANGSAIDWAAALDEHRRWMTTVVRSRVRDAHAAEEVMQEVALAVLQQDSRPRDASKIAPWLYRIAVRHTINFRRRHGRQRRLLERFAHSAADGRAPPSNPRDWVLAAETQQLVAAAMDELLPADCEILLLKYTEGWTYKQLAAHLGAKVKTVEHRLMKARRALRNRLRQRGFEENE